MSIIVWKKTSAYILRSDWHKLIVVHFFSIIFVVNILFTNIRWSWSAPAIRIFHTRTPAFILISRNGQLPLNKYIQTKIGITCGYFFSLSLDFNIYSQLIIICIILSVVAPISCIPFAKKKIIYSNWLEKKSPIIIIVDVSEIPWNSINSCMYFFFNLQANCKETIWGKIDFIKIKHLLSLKFIHNTIV